jgi:predicted homoserine dehydrogenase-like protein
LLFSLMDLQQGHFVTLPMHDYIVGAEPGPGVFVLGYNEHSVRQGYMKNFKMGNGPLYAFYIPYRLPHLEVPLTPDRTVLFKDAAVAPIAVQSAV